MSKQLSLDQKLFNLQQEIGTISKDATNPFYKSKYFDINSLINQLQPLLKKYKLLLKQPIIENVVYTKITCIDSKETELSGLELTEQNDPQKRGSEITYYRRYTLTSLLALQAEDDDANATVKKKPWLNKNTPKYSEAIDYLQKGGALETIKNKYQISRDVEKELSKL